MERQYLYYAIVTEAFPRVDEPALVCRRWVDAQGLVHEEAFTDEFKWEPEEVLTNIEAGRWTGEIHPITEEAGLRFEAIQYARVHRFDPTDGNYEYFKLVELGKTVLAIRTWISPQGHDLEETHTASGWLRSHVRSKLERDSMGGDLIPITQEEAESL
ncbi:hypothetical protein [Amycolatopsis sp. BJA-103]|uniref:hypothetical protein n=1 Tax=Amycolatopsis sp. BJA-103 TaxID=1911175 RepID=UPI000C76259D|nr:hypothetical protein [Amycolatopsis sp. BJA-103]AUI64032.1 hypothetical protein BKN51_41715 [Amycolatopsis sp. BJA-103]PNE16063.1 hypothetical protein B1H26_27600 [Amycolatopsis sp. BJA-103]